MNDGKKKLRLPNGGEEQGEFMRQLSTTPLASVAESSADLNDAGWLGRLGAPAPVPASPLYSPARKRGGVEASI